MYYYYHYILFDILISNKALQDRICEIIKKTIYDYKEEIYDETLNLYNQECIDNKYDFSSGLYNLDIVYTKAINKALNLGYDEL